MDRTEGTRPTGVAQGQQIRPTGSKDLCISYNYYFRRKSIFRQYDRFTQYISEVPEFLKKALYTQQLYNAAES
jgi:hypothetical protein